MHGVAVSFLQWPQVTFVSTQQAHTVKTMLNLGLDIDSMFIQHYVSAGKYYDQFLIK
jgi:hypothetical protein